MTKEDKPKCFGCGEVGEENDYYFYNGYLWHYSCIVHTDLVVNRFRHRMTEEEEKRLFISRLVEHNPVLRGNLGNDEELRKFIRKVLVPKGYDEEGTLLLIKETQI